MYIIIPLIIKDKSIVIPKIQNWYFENRFFIGESILLFIFPIENVNIKIKQIKSKKAIGILRKNTKIIANIKN